MENMKNIKEMTHTELTAESKTLRSMVAENLTSEQCKRERDLQNELRVRYYSY